MTFNFKLDTVTNLFNTPDRPADFKGIRRDIPRREDPLLMEIIQREGKIVEATKANPATLESTLLGENFEVDQKISTLGKKRKREATVWKDNPKKQRICQDHATWKVNASFLQTLKSPTADHHQWNSYTSNVKTCTSTLSQQDATFCGPNSGALVYLAPSSEHAFISASPCDVVSPSETHKGNVAYFQSARTTTQAYCADQFKYNVAFDLVHHVKSHSIEFLTGLIDINGNADDIDPNVISALDVLEKKGESIFDRKFYSSNSPQSNLEIEIDHIIAAIDAYPGLEKEINHSRQEFVELKQKVHDYLQHPDVIHRGVQRKTTTGWELTNSADQNHPLLPNFRSSHHKLKSFDGKLAQLGITIPELSNYPGTEELDPENAKKFIETNHEQFQKQICANTVAGYTITEAIAEKEKRQTTVLTHLDKIEKKAQQIISTSSDQRVRKKASKLQKSVVETKTPYERLYPEIQFRSKKLSVSGFGIKKAILDELGTPKFEGTLKDYREKKLLRKETHARLVQEEYDVSVLKLSAPSPALTQKEAEVAKLKKAVDDLDNEIAALQLDPSLATYRLINQSTKKNLPCFVHFG